MDKNRERNNELNTNWKNDEKKKKTKCNACDYTSSGKGILKLHQSNIHKQEKILKCIECLYVSLRNKNLKRHISTVHKGERNF